ncbi:MAG: disulfide bond formation protein B [Alphaproteobacteria bacterium]|nr:disulfide bond formation protein B [Alphaproteobacteria bacterium]
MNKHVECALRLLSNAIFVNAGIVAVSVVSLGSALTAEYVFGLQPCVLCLYQRIPFVVTTILGLTGLVLALNDRNRISAIMIALGAVAFLINSIIAFYHTGVEQHWWASAFEGCNVAVNPVAPGNLLESLREAQAVPCDVIPWADPVFGLSMANYNTMMCLGLAIGCGLCAWLIRNRKR